MDTQSRDFWQSDLLDCVLNALAADDEARGLFVFKGARVLALRLGGPHRRSLDLDASTREPVTDHQLKRVMDGAIRRAFSRADPIRYVLDNVDVQMKPAKGHPRGWGGFEIRLRIKDNLHASVRGLPAVLIDIGAPEPLLTSSTAPLLLAGNTAIAYSAERIAGEKARAFLESLPAHKAKLEGRSRTVRAKDIYDIHAITVKWPLEIVGFWRTAGEEFALACESRLVDCRGIESFSEGLMLTRATYDSDTAFRDVPFETAWASLAAVVGIWESFAFIPLEHPVEAVGGES